MLNKKQENNNDVNNEYIIPHLLIIYDANNDNINDGNTAIQNAFIFHVMRSTNSNINKLCKFP